MRFLLTLIVASVLTACATNPVTGKREVSFMSEDKEIAIGRELDAEIRQQMGLYEDEELQRYVRELGMDLARRSQRPNLPWSFAIVDSPAVNAFALPGGFIYIAGGFDDGCEGPGVGDRECRAQPGSPRGRARRSSRVGGRRSDAEAFPASCPGSSHPDPQADVSHLGCSRTPRGPARTGRARNRRSPDAAARS